MSSQKRKRIVITGRGLVSCFGTQVDRFYDRLLEGESGVRPIQEFDTENLPTKFAAWVRDFDPEEYVDRKMARRADPYINFAIYAGKRALEDAGLLGAGLERLDRTKCGVLIGSGMGGMAKYHEGVRIFHERGVKRVSPFFVPFIITNMGGALLAMDVGFQGPNYSISTACATGNYAIISAANHILRGEADLMLAGGVEAACNPISLGGFVACHALSERNDAPQQASRPWDCNRDGFVMGEGCGVIVLETLEHALKRGAPIYGEYLGGGVTCDAYHMTNMREDGSGIARAIEVALEQAEIAKEEVDYINAHATSTPLGDMTEIAGFQRVFGDHCKKLLMNGTKSLIGHSLGAAGAIESIVILEALKRQELHPTLNLEDPEPALNIDAIPHKKRKAPLRVALNNSAGFGGHNAAILFGLPPEGEGH